MPSSKLFDDLTLGEFAESFLGYGNVNAPVWFIGMEEGGGGSFGEISKRVNVWTERGKHPLEDIFAYHSAISLDQWFSGPRPKLQSTWSGLIRLQFGLTGKDPALMGIHEQTELIRDYQQNHLGRSTGAERLMELLPLPSPSNQAWLYAKHSRLPWLANRARYMDFQAPLRAAKIRKEVEVYKPKIVVFYGLGFRDHWTSIAGTKLAPTDVNNVFIGRHGVTTFAIVPHPVARGLTRDYFFKVGKTIAANC